MDHRPRLVHGEALAADPAEGHVGGADRSRSGARPRRAGRRRDHARGCGRRRSRPRPDRPSGVGRPADLAAGTGQQHRQPRPSPRPGGQPTSAGPGTSTSSTRSPARRARSAMPGVRDDPDDAGAVAVDPGGDRRALRRRGAPCPRGTSSTRTGRPCSSASRRATAATGESTLPPNAPPLASGVAGSPARLAPRRVGLEVGGLDPGGAQGQVPVTRRDVERRPDVDGRAPALDLARRSPRLGERLADGPAAPCRRARPPARRPGRGRRRTRPAPRATSGATRWGTPPSMAGPPARRRRGPACGRRLAPEATARRRGSCASRCSGTGGRPAPGRRRPRRPGRRPCGARPPAGR